MNDAHPSHDPDEPKDLRGILIRYGREALRSTMLDTEPFPFPPDPQPMTTSPPPPPPAEPFPIILASDISGVAEPVDFVEGLLTDGGASVVYGPSNCGKTFWILALAACVATGQDFRGCLKVDRGAVVYVALEGTQGARNRITAMEKAGLLPEGAPLFVCDSPVSLLEAGHAGKLAATVKLAAAQSSLPCRLVILDTLSRAMAGGDENSGPDMTRAVHTIDAIRAATGAHVCVIHHTGKDESRGARGHSSLRAAVDTEIEVFRPEDETISTVCVRKQRDLPICDPLPFSLEVVVLGTGRRGKPITSCIVHHEDSSTAATRRKRGRPVEIDPANLLKVLPQRSSVAWQLAAKTDYGISKSSFNRLSKVLLASGAVTEVDGFFKCAGEQEAAGPAPDPLLF